VLCESEVAALAAEVEGELLAGCGLEIHPFLTGWYDELVGEKFHLDRPPDTLALLVISQPAMFERTFLPYLAATPRQKLHDPIDACMVATLEKLAPRFPGTAVLHDFQLGRSRRPRVLVQTAGHVAGAVRFYQPGDYPELPTDRRYYPVCHHPAWGGWYALRGVALLPHRAPALARPAPPATLPRDEAVQLLRLYNECWQDWRWRDVGRQSGQLEQYSLLQRKYFETLPANRLELIDSLLLNSNNCPS